MEAHIKELAETIEALTPSELTSLAEALNDKVIIKPWRYVSGVHPDTGGCNPACDKGYICVNNVCTWNG